MKKRNTVAGPATVHLHNGDIEFSVHKISAALAPDMVPVLVEIPPKQMRNVLVVPTFQKCICPVIDWTEEARLEKDRLLEVFVEFASKVAHHVRSASDSYWCDYVDPCTGFPSVRGPSPYCEASAMEALLPYSKVHVGTSAGGCNMISHPKWDLSCYPATLFALCPPEVLLSAIKDVSSESSSDGESLQST